MLVGSRMESFPPSTWTESGRTPVLPEVSSSRQRPLQDQASKDLGKGAHRFPVQSSTLEHMLLLDTNLLSPDWVEQARCKPSWPTVHVFGISPGASRDAEAGQRSGLPIRAAGG